MRGGELERRAVVGVGPVLDYFRDRGVVAGTNLDVMGKVLEARVGVQPQSLSVYARDLAVIFQDLAKPVDVATSADVRRAVQILIKRGSARKRISLLRAALEAAGRAELVQLTRKLKIKEKRKLQDPDILVAEDVARLIRDAPTRRDKAEIALLWESGRRIHEVLALDVGDVVPIANGGDAYYRVVFRKSKTIGQEGSYLLVESAPYVAAWLGYHPLRASRAAPLFVDTIGNRLGRLTYGAVYAMLERVGAIARVGKPVRPHAFRHARITALLRAGWSEAQVKKAVGLSPRSQELARYAHLLQTDIDNAVLAMHGKAPLEPPRMSALPSPEDLENVPAMPALPPELELGTSWTALRHEDQAELVAKSIAQEILKRGTPAWQTDEYMTTRQALEDTQRLQRELYAELQDVKRIREDLDKRVGGSTS